jgi:hypothetical protein
MDSSTYGSMVERGGYATGGIVGEGGPELVWLNRGVHIASTATTLAAFIQSAFTAGRAVEVFRRDPDDGCAGVPAKV